MQRRVFWLEGEGKGAIKAASWRKCYLGRPGLLEFLTAASISPSNNSSKGEYLKRDGGEGGCASLLA